MKKIDKDKSKKKEPNKFRVSLVLGETNYKSQGDSVSEALGKLEIDRLKIKTYGFLTIKNGQKTSQAKITPFQIRRVAINRIFRNILAKKLSLTLK